MSTFLSKEVQMGLEAARKRELTEKSRLRVRFDGEVYPVLKYWETGFSVDADDAPQMRGLVDLLTAHVMCLNALSLLRMKKRVNSSLSSSVIPLRRTSRRLTLKKT